MAFEQLRLQPAQSVVERARRLGAYMQSHAGSCNGATKPVRDAREVMMETAIDLSVDPSATVAEAGATSAVHAYLNPSQQFLPRPKKTTGDNHDRE